MVVEVFGTVKESGNIVRDSVGERWNNEHGERERKHGEREREGEST